MSGHCCVAGRRLDSNARLSKLKETPKTALLLECSTMKKQTLRPYTEQLKPLLKLEMTVCFLRQVQQHHQAVASGQGYSRCVQKMMSFLHLLNHINQPLTSSKDKSPVNSALWRPW
uniref:BHLH domain-containing protein n=1 Tax=Amphilophus citrinellus TaxID=61819 RepID=A0A3Q0S226_AMPCI